MTDKILAFHFDLKRAMYSESYMDSYADKLAGWGYNTILYEVEDKFRHPRHPAIAHPDAITPEETTKRMTALRKRGFRVIPMVQSLGHAEYVLSKPGYEKFRESPDHTAQYDPLSEESRALVCELIDDLIKAVKPEKYFHIGGDETWNLGQSEKCKSIVEQIGTGGLYLKHMLPIIDHVIKRGLRPVLWADIALTHPEMIGSLPKELVLMDWDYWSGDARWPSIRVWGTGAFTWDTYQTAKKEGKIKKEFIELLERYAVDERTMSDGSFVGFPYAKAIRDMGFDVILAPATRCFGDSLGIPLNSAHLGNCLAAAVKGGESCLGTCVTSWAVRHSHPEVNLPGAFASALGSRKKASYEAQAFAAEFTKDFYGLCMPEFADALQQAEAIVPWCQSHMIPAAGKESEALDNWLAKVDGQPGGRKADIDEIKNKRAGLLAAKSAFESMRAKAKSNKRNIDYWLEGVSHTILCASFAIAALENSLKGEKQNLAKQLEETRRLTRSLFSETYPAASVESELDVRYGFLDAILLTS